MADLDFPSDLRADLVSARSGSQQAGFVTTDPAAGAFFKDPFTDDAPTIYDLQFTFTQGEARKFHLWVHSKEYGTNKGLKPFNFPLESEWGVEMQEVEFTEDGVPLRPVSQEAGLFTYRAQIIIRDVVNPDEVYADWILGLDSWQEWAAATNKTMNDVWLTNSELAGAAS